MSFRGCRGLGLVRFRGLDLLWRGLCLRLWRGLLLLPVPRLLPLLGSLLLLDV